MDLKLWETPLDAEILDTLVREFFEGLELGKGKGIGRVITVGGFPGSGKTSASARYVRLTKATHVQANDARVILTRHDMTWGENVPQIVGKVVERLLAGGRDVIVDGGIGHWNVRLNLEMIANFAGARIFHTAVGCSTTLAKERAKKRYRDAAMSSFGDWRAKPDKFETKAPDNPGYIESIDILAADMRNRQIGIPGLITLANNGELSDLSVSVGIASDMIDRMSRTISLTTTSK